MLFCFSQSTSPFCAAKLIEESGLKGVQIGQAQVSEKHANFIINIGDATADNIEKLIEHVEETVAIKFDIRLQREVKIVGEFLRN